MIWAALIGLAATWLGVLLAWDSFYWPPARHGWPVSFFVVALVFIFYVLARQPAARKTRRAAARSRGSRTAGARAPAAAGSGQG